MSHVLLRADAGRATGVGHVMRCLAIAESARERGDTVAMSGSVDDVGWLWDLLADNQIEMLEPAADAEAVVELGARTGSDAIVVDHYRLSGDLSGSPIPVASLVDGNFGARPADLLVDAGLAAGAPLASSADLRGPRFAPVRASVRAARERRAQRTAVDPTPWTHRPAKILLVLGGTDPLGLTHLLAHALSHLPQPAMVTAVVAPGSMWADQNLAVGWQTAKEAARWDVRDGLRLVAPGPQLPALLADADIVVSAAGTTSHELCHIGVPSAIVCVAENQRRGYDALVSHDVVIGLGDAADVSADPSAVTAGVGALLADPDRYERISVTASQLVDGFGGQRILGALGELGGHQLAETTRTRRQESR